MGMFTPLAFFAETAVAVLNCDTLALLYEAPWTYMDCLASSNSSVSLTYSFVTQSVPTINLSRNPIVVGKYGYFLGVQSPTSAWKRLDLDDYTTTIAITPSLPALSSPNTGNFDWPFYDGVDSIVFPPYNDYRWYRYNLTTTQTTIAFTHSERVGASFNQRFNGSPIRRNDRFYSIPIGNNASGQNYQSYIYSYDPSTKIVATGPAQGDSQTNTAGWPDPAGSPQYYWGRTFALNNDGWGFFNDGSRRTAAGSAPGYKFFNTIDFENGGVISHTQSIQMPNFSNFDEFIRPVFISATMAIGFSCSTTPQIQAVNIWATSSTTTKTLQNKTARTITGTITSRAWVMPNERLPDGRHIIVTVPFTNNVYLYDIVNDTYALLGTAGLNSGCIFWYNNKLHIQTSTTSWRIYTFNFTQYFSATRYQNSNNNST